MNIPNLNNYLEDSLISVPTIVSYTIINNSEVLLSLVKINNIDEATIENKLRSYLGPEMLNDKSSIILVPFLCCLMYKNDIFPKFISDILTILNITDVTIKDLKSNSENLVNILLENYTGGRKKGGANFKQIFNVLLQISFVIWYVLYDYYIITNNLIPDTYNKSKSIIQTIQTSTLILKNMKEKCSYVKIPDMIRYLDKYFLNDYDVENIYRAVICVANRHFDENLQTNIFIPQNMEITNFNVRFDEIRQIGIQKTEEIVSTSLVPADYNFDEKTQITNFIDPEKLKEQMVLINTQIQPVIQNIEQNIDGLIIYDGETIDLDKTKTQLLRFKNMQEEEFFDLMYPEGKESVISKKTDRELTLLEFATDTINLLFTMSKTIIENPVSKITALDISKQYYWIIQDYCTQKLRDIEDLQTTSQRNVEDFIKKANRTKQNILDLIQTLKWLIPGNIHMICILASWIYNFSLKIKKTITKSRPTTENLSIENNNAIENSSGGRKTKKNKRKIRQNRKTRKNKKNNTRKLKKRKY